ncbi:MAG: RNA-binding protein [Anaerolineae bacterium]|nr:RNA-binding protein [Anaerolineae bacterium]
MNHKRIYVGDIAPEVTENDLAHLFGEHGPIESVSLMRNPNHGLHAYAFVEMQSPEDARAAVQKLNGHTLAGSRLIVYTVPPKSRPRPQSQAR